MWLGQWTKLKTKRSVKLSGNDLLQYIVALIVKRYSGLLHLKWARL